MLGLSHCANGAGTDSQSTSSASPDIASPDIASPDIASPDLSFVSYSVSSTSVKTDASFSFSAVLSNRGISPSPSTNLRYYESTDAVIDTSDTEVGSPMSLSALVPQSEESTTAILTAPSSAGTYYYGACVDAVSEESDTSNNCSNSLMLTVSTPRLIAVGRDGNIISSDDNGVNWTAQTSGTTNFLSDIVASGNRLIAVGDGGKVITSDDNGVNWTAQTSGLSGYSGSLYSIISN